MTIVSRGTALFMSAANDHGHRAGRLVEFDKTSRIFGKPSDQRTVAYITGRFG